MKLAIYERKGSFTDEWINYCKTNNIEYFLVNPFNNDFLEEIKKSDGFMWNWHLHDKAAMLIAKQLTYVIENMNIPIFPNFSTIWHYDDKIGQKYLFSAKGIPFVPTYIFFNREEALKWINGANFPLVMKLKGGAGSVNVKLIKNKKNAKKIINKAFTKGIKSNDLKFRIFERLWRIKKGFVLRPLLGIFKTILIEIYNTIFESTDKEKNYIYFQKFIPNNNYDIRVIVIGERAFAIKRFVRKNDFRASGSMLIDYSHEQIPLECIKVSFEAARKLDMQICALDFIFEGKTPLITEISYDFVAPLYHNCKGYFDKNLKWISTDNKIEYFIINDFIKIIGNKK